MHPLPALTAEEPRQALSDLLQALAQRQGAARVSIQDLLHALATVLWAR